MPNHSRRKPEDGKESDAELWQKFTSGIKPLPRPRSEARQAPATAPSPPPPAPVVVTERRAALPPLPSAHVASAMPPSPSPLAPGSAAGLDQRTLLRLKRGLLRPQTQIDLHRMTQGRHMRHLAGSSPARNKRAAAVFLSSPAKATGPMVP